MAFPEGKARAEAAEAAGAAGAAGAATGEEAAAEAVATLHSRQRKGNGIAEFERAEYNPTQEGRYIIKT